MESFITDSLSASLRQDVISELRKTKTISIVPDAVAADSVLGGGGEIWIKGYQSLNPRSGRLPSSGRPIYDGYLSVELKDEKGRTFWSDLVMPATATHEVSKELAKHIAKEVARALEAGEPTVETASLPQAPAALKGAGASFPGPVYAKWFKNYQRENPGLEINYDAVGSEAGVRQLLAGSVDFGASDSPAVIHDLAPDEQAKFLLFPSVVGAVVPIVNLPGFFGPVSFTPDILANIYLGKIRKWNDPSIKAANGGRTLPDLDIVVVHRSDGSGTSYAWTDYLSKANSGWKTQVGSSLTPRWPVGKEANGNDGVAKLVKELGGAIGYVEFIYALQNHISFGKVQNRHGEFVAASLESMGLAVNSSLSEGGNYDISIVDPPGAEAYPISSFTWLLFPAQIENKAKREAVKGFLRWMLGPGQRQAAALGYLALPKRIVERELAAISKIG